MATPGDKIEHIEVVTVPKETRERKMTEKGLIYMMDVKLSRLQQLCRGLERNISVMQELMDTYANPEQVRQNYKIWLTLYGQFIDTDDAYRKLLDPKDLDDYNDNWFFPRNTAMLDFKEITEDWFKNFKPNEPELDSISTVSKSSSKTKSSSSSARTIQSMKLKEEEKRIELQVRTETLKKTKQLELQKVELKMKEKEIALNEEKAISEAKCKVFEEIETSSRASSRHSRKSDIQQNEALVSVVRHLNKPIAELSKFDGDPLQYHRFMRQFRSRIVGNCETEDEKLNYLEQYTSGEPQKIIIGYSYLDANRGYPAALQELEERYGDQDVIVNAFINKALSWPIIRADNPKELDRFSIFLKECQNAVHSLDALKVLEFSETLKKLVSKLPFHLHDRWRSTVSRTRDKGQSVKFSQLVDFVKAEAKKLIDPTYGREALTPDRKLSTAQRSKGSKGSYAINSSEAQDADKKVDFKPASNQTTSGASYGTNQSSQKSNPSGSTAGSSGSSVNKSNGEIKSAFKVPCLFCNDKQHALECCQQLSKRSYSDRLAFLRTQGFCFACLKLGHSRNICRNRATCQKCQRRHPTVLHNDFYLQDDTKQKIEHSGSAYNNNNSGKSFTNSVGQIGCHTGAGDPECTMAVIPVTLRSKNGMKLIRTYAFLDPGSNVSFCSDQVASELGVSGSQVKIRMDTMGETQTMFTNRISNLEIANLNGDEFIEVPPLYTKDRMPVTRQHIATSRDISQWSHLKNISLPQIDKDIGLLIGNNLPDAYTPIEIRTGPRGSPHASRTILGWIVWNVMRYHSSNDIHVNRVEVTAIQQTEDLKNLSKLYQKSVDIDFPERIIDDKLEPSQEDHIFMEKVQNSITMQNGHYELCLPFRKDVMLPDNKSQAFQRLQSLKKKMNDKENFHNDYTKFMESIIDKGYAVEVPKDELSRQDGKVWHLPHHGVYHNKKPGKIRVVFDCAAVYKGVSLNSVLLQGPDLTNNLLGVLLRFREHSVAIMADIEAMFHQVQIPKEDQDCLRFYWWPKGRTSDDPQIYKMVVHLFGAVSSPSCCNMALQKTAYDNCKDFPSASQAVLSNFYVDDFLKSVTSEEEAINLVQEITELLQRGGFRLTKWVSSSKRVLESVPEEERAKGLKDLSFDKLPTERALGVYWSILSDSFGFQITEKNVAPTRRNILSYVSSVYDPLGLGAPVILTAKILLQDLCRLNMEWDSELSGSYLIRWQQWLRDLPQLAQLSVSRCLKPPDFGEAVCTHLHYFSDASELGYGIVSYIRFTNKYGQIHCQLLVSKTRVAPLKKMTIPRMELTAATTAVKIHKKLQDELSIPIDMVFYWTDSMTVLRYIANEKSRFHTFVANRVTIIREGSTVSQWQHIESSLNPADVVSRGLSAGDLLKMKQWLKGPDMLWEPFPKWIQNETLPVNMPIDDPEVKKEVNVTHVAQDDDSPIDRMIHQYSSWTKLKRVTAWILLYAKKLKQLSSRRKELITKKSKVINDKKNSDLQVNEEVAKHRSSLQSSLQKEILQNAEKLILLRVQMKHFPREIKAIQDGNCILKQSAISRLDPFISDELLRVGGRLGQSSMEFEARHPIILPKDSPVSRLILEKTHKDVGHLGRNTILSSVRQQYWIIGANSIIRNFLSRCSICIKYRARTMNQKMADLPVDRITAGEPPFTRTGVDYFGPFQVKRGRSSIKRYGVIFTCLTSRAVHLEIAHTLDTDSCINAIRRFIARRGPVKLMFSDNGTNLVGAERELRQEVEKWNKVKFQESLHEITWKFNPPASSHFGGFWERLIRSVRKIMYSLMHQQNYKLDDEGLQTLFCEIEAILNNRPLTNVSSDPSDIEVLTPNHLLKLRGGESLPCGAFCSDDNYPRRRWRQIQYLADIFWTRWVREYLPTLQARQKWTRTQRNVCVGDIVLVVDNTPRNSWTLGRILEVMKDRKGMVRVVRVKTPTSVLQRPVHKLCLILENQLPQEQ